jgi:acetyl esterase
MMHDNNHLPGETDSPGEPLYSIIRRLRRPYSLRELMAACLRSAYMGDPFTGDKTAIPEIPKQLLEDVTVSEVLLSGVPCSIYAPRNFQGKLPAMIYMHGGGFVIGCADDTDYITRVLCQSNQMIVISMNYRLAPETIFPGALDDCEKVFCSILSDAAAHGVDNKHFFLGGDSAGGNLALALCQRLSQQQTVSGLVLLAPWLDMELEKYSSYNTLAPTGIVMDAPFLAYSRAAYVGFNEWRNPLVSPLYCDVSKLPPTIIIVGDADPLIDQAVAFAGRALNEQFKKIELETFAGMPHCFYSFPNVFKEEETCYGKITDFITRIMSRHLFRDETTHES